MARPFNEKSVWAGVNTFQGHVSVMIMRLSMTAWSRAQGHVFPEGTPTATDRVINKYI